MIDLNDYLKLDFRYYLLKHIKEKNSEVWRGYSLTELKKLVGGRIQIENEYKKKLESVEAGKITYQDLYNEVESYLVKCIDGNAIPVHFERDVKTKKYRILRFEEYGEIWATFDFLKQLTEEKKTAKSTQQNLLFFISHSSRDKDLITAFVDRILLLGLRLNGKDIFCTSIDDMTIKSGEDFKQIIKSKLQSAQIVIQVITENYKKSEVCLNEMGAAWALGLKVIPFIVEPIRYDNVGFIHDTAQLLRINSKRDLLKFKDDHAEIFQASSFHSSNYNRQIDEFIKEFPSRPYPVIQKSKAKNAPTQQDFNNYFGRFLEEDVDLNNLLLKAQPNLSDCKTVFKNNIYKDIYQLYSIIYKGLIGSNTDQSNIETKETFIVKSSTYGDLEKRQHELPGGMDKVFDLRVLKPGMTYYSVSFIELHEEFGVSFKVWCFINGRWVWFPKMWRIIDRIIALKNNKGMAKLINVLKRLGIQSDLKKDRVEAEFVISYIINELINESKSND